MRNRMGAYHTFLEIFLKSKALFMSFFAPLDPFSRDVRIKAEIIGTNTIRKITAAPISRGPKMLRIYNGNESTKVTIKKVVTFFGVVGEIVVLFILMPLLSTSDWLIVRLTITVMLTRILAFKTYRAFISYKDL